MQKGDPVKWRKWYGRIHRVYENNICTIELYGYRGLELCYRDCSTKEIFELKEKAAV
jgi:hypothetical protein